MSGEEEALHSLGFLCRRHGWRRSQEGDEALGIDVAEKWEQPHGQVAHFVKTSMAISLCRSVTLMLRGGRIRRPDRIVIHSGDAMECLQTGHDELKRPKRTREAKTLRTRLMST
ncbi:hypothetical protein THAOC_13804 [Thalassiosira oceanica]|uniref:Uncharacterized protein n=1 Tax=Thalassiosira oceanica TaxID=159749 RepID=K0SJ27_THAOC|nr:hypothetical protein THAOC_13804 [Thalassiosira oceanica]|eukprot:EJK65345.1 hypothetical protein THAOC_13804 [Thalassiosira oceanica]